MHLSSTVMSLLVRIFSYLTFLLTILLVKCIRQVVAVTSDNRLLQTASRNTAGYYGLSIAILYMSPLGASLQRRCGQSTIRAPVSSIFHVGVLHCLWLTLPARSRPGRDSGHPRDKWDPPSIAASSAYVRPRYLDCRFIAN